MATNRRPRLERVSLFSDGVFAVLITILVLELKPPHGDTFAALIPLWPTGLSYAVSFFFIAIVWINHHHLFSYAGAATPKLVWSNFLHLFAVSLIPFTTEWNAETRLTSSAPVVLYAAVFVLVNCTYLALCWEAVDQQSRESTPRRLRRMLQMRSFVTVVAFSAAAVIALRWPAAAMGVIIVCLMLYLRPDIPGADQNADRNEAPARHIGSGPRSSGRRPR